MRTNLVFVCVSFLFIFLYANCFANEDPIPGFHHYQEQLSLSSSASTRCQAIFRNIHFKGDFSYYQVKNLLQEDAVGLVENPNNKLPPITAELSTQGDNDRLAFAHYYHPARHYFIQNKGVVGLYAIIFNVCPNHVAEAAVEFVLPPAGEVCLFSTQVWDYCR